MLRNQRKMMMMKEFNRIRAWNSDKVRVDKFAKASNAFARERGRERREDNEMNEREGGRAKQS